MLNGDIEGEAPWRCVESLRQRRLTSGDGRASIAGLVGLREIELNGMRALRRVPRPAPDIEQGRARAGLLRRILRHDHGARRS